MRSSFGPKWPAATLGLVSLDALTGICGQFGKIFNRQPEARQHLAGVEKKQNIPSCPGRYPGVLVVPAGGKLPDVGNKSSSLRHLRDRE